MTRPIACTILIAKTVRTCRACPSQWDAWTPDGQYLYLRYRHGTGSIEHHPGPDQDAWDYTVDPTIRQWNDGTQSGSISLTDFLTSAGAALTPDAQILGEPEE
ncbi:hypothetical protein [Streptomyces sp. NPDC005953]|uniref:hypothetical protein n=1 Tax=Streptomyces sp. NPDC005953 TaxID=3156719 RepID=UPI0033F4E390